VRIVPDHPDTQLSGWCMKALDPEAVSVDEFARCSGFGRSTIYEALNPAIAAQKGWPVLRSIKLGKARRIRLSVGREWLANLERRSSGETIPEGAE
jgi:hypothetical protein